MAFMRHYVIGEIAHHQSSLCIIRYNGQGGVELHMTMVQGPWRLLNIEREAW